MKTVIDTAHVKEVCLLGEKERCCSYLVASSGFQCAKTAAGYEGVLAAIKARLAANLMAAQGDNCDGYNYTEEQA